MSACWCTLVVGPSGGVHAGLQSSGSNYSHESSASVQQDSHTILLHCSVWETRELPGSETLERKIVVPFPVEAPLSGRVPGTRRP